MLNYGRLGCDFQDLRGTTGKPGVHSRGNSGSKSKCDSESIEQDVFRVIVQFHHDGKFTVCSDESEITAKPTEIDIDTLAYVADTICTCAYIVRRPRRLLKICISICKTLRRKRRRLLIIRVVTIHEENCL